MAWEQARCRGWMPSDSRYPRPEEDCKVQFLLRTHSFHSPMGSGQRSPRVCGPLCSPVDPFETMTSRVPWIPQVERWCSPAHDTFGTDSKPDEMGPSARWAVQYRCARGRVSQRGAGWQNSIAGRAVRRCGGQLVSSPRCVASAGGRGLSLAIRDSGGWPERRMVECAGRSLTILLWINFAAARSSIPTSLLEMGVGNGPLGHTMIFVDTLFLERPSMRSWRLRCALSAGQGVSFGHRAYYGGRWARRCW